MTDFDPEVDSGAPRRLRLRRSRTVRLAALGFGCVCAAAVHGTASAHLGAIDALWLAGAVVAALCASFARYERRQPVLLELTPEGIAGFGRGGQRLFQGRIVGFSQWAERLLVFAVAGPEARRSDAFVVAADAVDAAAFRALAVRGRHAAY
ncbi:hypothetical protein C0Z18_13985 [Trinickia dabaoshanensis]|uniref:Uncharacterized protein n=1 Tax=Trinickia dabaoshanensis TaxID=564714 RepID=A0A2N7VQJ6_9BURK|nr:hypothetical protein [Trinickia dabaoshanensis]PMS19424.1 hypothetical protein C0Z18_13985 [Trinickia dabaoshanensis]